MDPDFHDYSEHSSKSVNSFSVPPQDAYKHNDLEFDSEKLNFAEDVDTNKIEPIDNSQSNNSKIGIEDSRELSRINRMYDILYTDKHTIFNLEECMDEPKNFPSPPERQGTLFGLEEDAQLGEDEKVRIVNTIVRTQGGSKHTDYKIVGKLGEEQFIIMRRYKEFDVLRKRLEERWPGFYIPPIPKKKAVGKMDFKIVSERMMILNRFLIEISDRKYFWESEEMRIFIKPENSVMGELRILHRLSIEEILERIKQEAEINIQVSSIELEDHTKTIQKFKESLVANLPFLNRFKSFLSKQLKVSYNYLR